MASRISSYASPVGFASFARAGGLRNLFAGYGGRRLLFDFGLVSAYDWGIAAFGVLVVVGAVAVLAQAFRSDAALGLGLVLLAWGHDLATAPLHIADVTEATARILYWIASVVSVGGWLVGYVILIGAVPAGWNRIFKRLSFRIAASATVLWLIIASQFLFMRRAFLVEAPRGGVYLVVAPGAESATSAAFGWIMGLVVIALMLMAIVVAIGAYLRADSPLAKRSARAYVIGLFPADAYFVILGSLALLRQFGFTWVDPLLARVPGVLPFGIWLALWVGYAIFSTKLFDIDLRIKRTISRGTIVSIFVAVFLVASIFIENYLQEKMGLVGGAVAAGTLLFALNRLQNIGAAVADKLMPTTVATPAYEAHRKIEVYREAAREVLEDGTVTGRERSLLRRLQDQLGLDDGSVQAVESEIAPHSASQA